MTTGEKIAACRKEKNLTQGQLAETLGVTRQAVSRWESDLAFPETDTLVKMSRMFNVSCDYLLNYNENEKENEKPPQEETGKFVFDLKKFYFEYKSKTMIGSLPLVHVNIGFGRVAKGFFSFGLVSAGVVSAGILSVGVISFGLICLGLLCFASIAGGLVALGGVAIGGIALGGLAIGVFAMGGCAIGAFACGGFAYGSYIAIGDVAIGGIALGDSRADGNIISVLKSEYEIMKPAVYEKFDSIPKFWSGFTAIFKQLAKVFMTQ